MQILETERLILRSFQQTDLDEFFENAKSPNVGPNAGWPPHQKKEESQQILDTFMASKEVWAIERKYDHKLVGSVGLHKDYLRSAENLRMLGYVLGENYWGYGYMTEAAQAVIDHAFKNMDIVLISVHHYTYNLRSKRVIEKCGFQYEGTLRHASKIYNGNIYDLACYSITKEEWANHKT